MRRARQGTGSPANTPPASDGGIPRPQSAPGNAQASSSSGPTSAPFSSAYAAGSSVPHDPTRPPAQSALNNFKLEASQQLIPTQSYLKDRARAVTNIESHIVELGSIFNQLAGMVAEQGQDVQTIYDNTDESLANVQAGHSELLKFYNSIRGNRALILKIFGVLLFFITFFIVFLA